MKRQRMDQCKHETTANIYQHRFLMNSLIKYDCDFSFYFFMLRFLQYFPKLTLYTNTQSTYRQLICLWYHRENHFNP